MGYNRFDPGCCCEEGCDPDAFLDPFDTYDSPPWAANYTHNGTTRILQADGSGNLHIKNTTALGVVYRCVGASVLEDGFAISVKGQWTSTTPTQTFPGIVVGNTPGIGFGFDRDSTGQYSFSDGVTTTLFGTAASGDDLEMVATDVGGGDVSVEVFINGVSSFTDTFAFTIADDFYVAIVTSESIFGGNGSKWSYFEYSYTNPP